MRRALACALLALAAPLAAQSPLDDPAAALEAARARLEALGDPQEADQGWLEAISKRIALLEELAATRRQRTEIASTEAIAERRTKAEDARDLEQGTETPTEVRLESAEEVTAYQDRARAARTARDQKRREDEEISERRSALREEQRELPARRSGLRERLDKKPDEDDEIGQYQLENAKLEERVCEERSEFLSDASQALMALAPVVQLEADTATAAHARVDKALKLARTEAARLREEAAAAARRKKEEEERRAEAEQNPLEKFRRRIQAAIAGHLADIADIETELDQLDASIAVERAEVERIEREQRRLLAGSFSVKSLLDKALERRDRVDRVEQRYSRQAFEFSKDLMIVRDRIWILLLPEEENDELRSLIEESGDAEGARKVFSEVVTGREGLLTVLRRKRARLEEAEQRAGQMEALAGQHDGLLHDLIEGLRKQLLWQRSDAVLSGAGLARIGDELERLAELAGAEETSVALDEMWQQQRVPLLGVVLLIVAAIVLRRRFGHVLRDPAPTGQRGMRAWGPGLAAIVFWAAPVPAALILLSEVADEPEEPAFVTVAVSSFLLLQAVLLLVRRVGVVLFAPGGLAVRLEASVPEVAAQLHYTTRVLTWGGQILWAPAAVLSETPLALDMTPRILLIGWTVWALFGIEQLLSTGRSIYRHWSEVSPALRTIFRVLAPLMVVALGTAAVASFAGYGAIGRLITFRSLVLALTAVGLGWLYVAMVRLGQRAAARIRARSEEGERDRLSALAARTALPRAAAVVVIAVIAFLIFRFFGVGSLLVEEMRDVVIYGEDGKDQLTMLDCFAAVIWIAAGHVISHFIGRVHAAISEAAEVDRGSLFAVVTLARYAIVLIGYSAALLAIGLDPENLAWLITAASVGLGFGLQEIVANFISGLILLFEQPIRIGDTVTVGDTGGTVEKITIRSTVVTNWERQTIIIPNKNFITENLTNWTRNDRVMRRVLEIKVDYGADIERILKVLDEVVGGHPAVLDKPPHRLFVQGFGEYSLDFEVWFYTDIDVGLKTKTELYRAIYERFEREGISIPVPIRRTLRS